MIVPRDASRLPLMIFSTWLYERGPQAGRGALQAFVADWT